MMSDEVKVRSGDARKGEARQSLLLIQGVIQVILRDLKSFRSMSFKEADELTLSGSFQMSLPLCTNLFFKLKQFLYHVEYRDYQNCKLNTLR